MTEVVQGGPLKEPRLPSDAEVIKWYNNLPSVTPEQKGPVQRLIDEALGRLSIEEAGGDWPLLRTIQEGLTPEDVDNFQRRMEDPGPTPQQ